MSGAGPVRVAMWSGPRNISTAMMRSFGSRADTRVVDEPFYAHYLVATGLDHPGRDLVMASQPTDWHSVVRALTGPLPPGIKIHYQKHMAQHLLPGMDRRWIGTLANAYLIRDPDEVVASYARVRGEPTLEDLGYSQQVELHNAYGGPVVDARDVLTNPLGVDFDARMLRWPAGPRDTDGVWAPYWYDAVERSTGFGSYQPPSAPLPQRLRPVADAARPLYAELHARRIPGEVGSAT